jgi:hypothetical protein
MRTATSSSRPPPEHYNIVRSNSSKRRRRRRRRQRRKKRTTATSFACHLRNSDSSRLPRRVATALSSSRARLSVDEAGGALLYASTVQVMPSLGETTSLRMPASFAVTHDASGATSRKKGFHSPPLVPNVFGPRLKGPSVLVHLKMWARGISPGSNGPFGPGFSHQRGLMPLGL